MNAHVARLLAAAFATLILLAGAAAFSVGFMGALERGAATPAERLEGLSQALLWSHVTGIGALSLLSFVLFALAWYLREQLIAPLERLKRSLAASAGNVSDEPIWGVSRQDEIGAVARAAENLRLSASAQSHIRLLTGTEGAERLAKSAERLEQQADQLPEIAGRMRERVEEASLRAAKASHMAAEAANLARAAAVRIGNGSEPEPRALETLIETVERLAVTMARFEKRFDADRRSTEDVLTPSSFTLFGPDAHAPAEAFPNPPGARDFGQLSQRPVIEAIAGTVDNGGAMDSTLVLESLVGNLDALERYANERKAIQEDEAVAFMAALIEAIDRLNSVADRICATADASAIRAAE